VTPRATITRFVAALTLAGAATIGPVSQPAQAAITPTHVAVVVANLGSACVSYHSGMTGGDVLDANFTVQWGGPPSYVGFVLKINGVGTPQPTTTRYWAYYHNTGGGWAYSGSGATSYHPQPGTVEGWAYDNGSPSPPTPPGTSYAAICGQDPAPLPAPTPPHPVTHAPSTHRVTPAPTGRPGQPGSPTSATGGGAHSSASTPAAGSQATSSTRPHSSARTKSSSAGTESNDPSSSSGASQPAVQLVGAKESDKHNSAAPAVGTALALLTVVGLGAAAFWRLRRQKLG
jgi:hypothetical protein